MTLQEFKELIRNLGIYMDFSLDGDYHNKSDLIGIKWSTGGVSGGSCWDEGNRDPHYPTSGEPQPNFNSLDLILEVVCPKITYLEHKKLLRNVMITKNYCDNDYYGNYTNYSQIYVEVDNLHKYLVENDLL